MSNPITQALDEMQARCDAATEGPWRAALLDGVDHADGSSGYRGGIYPGQFPGSAPVFLTNNIDARDAAFVADARTSLPKALAALKAVLEEHRPEGHGPDCYCCLPPCTCGHWEHPCPTVKAIAETLGVDEA